MPVRALARKVGQTLACRCPRSPDSRGYEYEKSCRRYTSRRQPLSRWWNETSRFDAIMCDGLSRSFLVLERFRGSGPDFRQNQRLRPATSQPARQVEFLSSFTRLVHCRMTLGERGDTATRGPAGKMAAVELAHSQAAPDTIQDAVAAMPDGPCEQPSPLSTATACRSARSVVRLAQHHGSTIGAGADFPPSQKWCLRTPAIQHSTHSPVSA